MHNRIEDAGWNPPVGGMQYPGGAARPSPCMRPPPSPPPPPPMNNQELYSVMVQITWTLKTQALTNMQVQWRPKSAGKWHPFQWEAIFHCPTAEGHRAVPSSVSKNGDGLHVWLTGRADLIRLPKNNLQANRPGIRRHYTVPLHAAEHTAMRTAICLTGASKQGGVR